MNMKHRHTTRAMLAMGGLFAFVSVQAHGSSLVVHREGDVSYVTGGIGMEERETLEAMQKDYNVRIVSSEMSGDYLDATPIVISDSAKHEVVHASAGPLFYAQLPAGRYKVRSSNDGQDQTQDIVITKNSPPVRIHFSWKASVADITPH